MVAYKKISPVYLVWLVPRVTCTIMVGYLVWLVPTWLRTLCDLYHHSCIPCVTCTNMVAYLVWLVPIWLRTLCDLYVELMEGRRESCCPAALWDANVLGNEEEWYDGLMDDGFSGIFGKKLLLYELWFSPNRRRRWKHTRSEDWFIYLVCLCYLLVYSWNFLIIHVKWFCPFFKLSFKFIWHFQRCKMIDF